jgi:hypothetical protein
MASFMTDLWESIFVPGPTPTILVATNAAFAALQIVLLALLAATYSIHFAILSVLCAGLWYSINWFAREVVIAQKKQADEDAAAAAHDQAHDKGGDDSDTEVETTARQGRQRLKKRGEGAAGAQAKNLEVSPGGDTQSSVSTEDEWEKVSGSDK